VKSFEVLIGLDGCTDRTGQIVNSFGFPKIFVLNERRGKHAVINFLLKKARGEICIVHDADLQFNCDKQAFERMLEIFRDKRIGAIADNYTVNYDIRSKPELSALYLGDLWNMYFLLEYKTQKFAKPFKESLLEVPKEGNAKYFFFVNIFRKDCVKPQETLCDDGERLFDVLENGKKAVLLPLMQKPYLTTSIEVVSLKDLFRQKFRGAIARMQIARKYGSQKEGLSMLDYCFFAFKNLYRTKRIKAFFGVIYWWMVTAFALLAFKLFPPKNQSTKAGWKLRIARG
jgi:glycosyltransferase involved in cell wall biosynthesis